MSAQAIECRFNALFETSLSNEQMLSLSERAVPCGPHDRSDAQEGTGHDARGGSGRPLAQASRAIGSNSTFRSMMSGTVICFDRRRMARIGAMSSTVNRGFGRKSSGPPLKLAIRRSRSLRPLITIAGIDLLFCFNCFSQSKRFPSGSANSRRRMSFACAIES